jgi:hypothetical protein
MAFYCAACGAEVSASERVGRRDVCGGCGVDLHACRQCALHEPAVYNECREPQAERVLDKTRANFCDYFTPRSGRRSAAVAGAAGATGDPERRLDALFRKGR